MSSKNLLNLEDVAVLELTDEESSLLRSKFLELDKAPFDDIEDFLKRSREIIVSVGRITEIVDKFNNEREKVALLIRNLPVDTDLPLTNNLPRFYNLTKDTYLSEGGVLGIGSLIGELFSYTGGEASLIETLFPIEEEAYRRSGSNSKIMLPFHIDRAYHQVCPLVISLFCLRGDPEAATYVSSLDKIMKELEPSELDVLKQPVFINYSNSSYGPLQEKRKRVDNVSIIRGTDEPHIFLSGPCEAETPEAEQALVKLTAAAEKLHNKVFLEAGDLLFIKNTRSLHARSTFTPKFDGHDRLLQITQLHKNLWDHIPFPCRIVDTAPAEYVKA